MSNAFPKLHNAMWPGLVGKASQGGDEPDLSLKRMLELTAAAEVDGRRFDGVDYFLFHPHTDPFAGEDELLAIADLIDSYDLAIGSLVAPIWPGTVGGSAMGSQQDRKNFVTAVKQACHIARIFNEQGVRKYGVIRIDSAESGTEKWVTDPEANTKLIAETFREAAKVAADHGERLAAEGEVCWAGMHSWREMLNLLEEVGMPETLGFQADLAHTYLYLLGVNAPEHALLQPGYSKREFWAAYQEMTDSPATLDDRFPCCPKRRDRSRQRRSRQNRTPLSCGRSQRQTRHHEMFGLLVARCGGSRHQAHLLGRLYVSQRKT